MTLRLIVRVDSVGKYNPDSMRIEGVRSQQYLTKVRLSFQRITFHPAVLFPDRCAVPGSAFLTFVHR